MRRPAVMVLLMLLLLAATPARALSDADPHTEIRCEGPLATVRARQCSHSVHVGGDGAVHASAGLRSPLGGRLPDNGFALSEAGFRATIDLVEPVAVLEASAFIEIAEAWIEMDRRAEAHPRVLLHIYVDGPCDECYPSYESVEIVGWDTGLRAVGAVNRSISLGYAPACSSTCNPLVPAGRYTVTVAAAAVVSTAGIGGHGRAWIDATIRSFTVTPHPA